MSISNELLKASETASKNYGIPKEVILGFAGLETSYGTAGAGKSKNNLFGIMNADGTAKTYSSVAESVEDFAKLVTGNKDSAQSKKYGKATANATTSEEWVNAIRDSGYNSEYADGVYEKKVMNVIDSIGGKLLGTESKELGISAEDLSNKGLKWWGDIVVVVVAVLLIVGGVVFLGMGVTSTAIGNKTVSKLTKVAKEVI